MKLFTRAALILAIAAFPATVAAQSSGLTVHGYLTQGYVDATAISRAGQSRIFQNKDRGLPDGTAAVPDAGAVASRSGPNSPGSERFRGGNGVAHERREPQTIALRGARAAPLEIFRTGTVSDLPLSILVVDDQPEVIDVIRRGLADAGHRVEGATTGETGLEKASSETFDVIILDVILPGMDGFQVANQLRDRGVTTPILMLTTRDAEGDVIQGLKEGADVYLPKPFRIGELEAHLTALRRRVGMEKQTVLRVDDVELDRVQRTVRRTSGLINLTNIEFKLLETLMLRPGRVFSKEELLHLVWGLTFDPGTGVLNVHLGNLRSKLEQDGHPRVIRTVRGRGYAVGEPHSD